MKLPGLPLELWTNKAITDITNTIGNLYYLDDRCLGDKNKHTTRVLIENDFTGGGFQNALTYTRGHAHKRKSLISGQCPSHASAVMGRDT